MLMASACNLCCSGLTMNSSFGLSVRMIEIQSYLHIALRIFYLILCGLMFRFVGVQAQLKASEENSKLVLAAIQRSKTLQYFVYAVLLINSLAVLFERKILDLVRENEYHTHLYLEVYLVLSVTNVLFICVFCHSLEKVNQQLAKFFILVSVNNFPKKTISVFLVMFFILGANQDVLVVLEAYKINLPFQLWHISMASYMVFD